jgi:hypothetical protein
MSTEINSDFYVVAREPGAESPSLPTWASRKSNPINLDTLFEISKVKRKDIPEVPGTFQLLNVFTEEECKRFIEITESLGYLKDAAVSLPREIRHNDNLTWVTDEATDQLIWERVKHLTNNNPEMFDNQEAVGINARFRFYRYSEGDYFKNHIDGAWPGSRVVNEELIHNAYPDRYSQMTFLILLNEDFEGGATRFLVNSEDPTRPARGNTSVEEVDIRTPIGGVLCFPHGHHPLHCLHSSQPISKGTKYIIRTDLLFTV